MPTTSTIQQYTSTWQARLDQITDLTVRKRHLLLFMSNAGRITGPSGGRFVEWPLFAQVNRPRGFGRNTPPNFQAPDNLRMPQLAWSAYHYGEELHVLDVEQNMGKEQFIDIVVNATNSVERSFSEEWGYYLFQDGSTASEEMPMFGLKSAFKYYNVATATAAAPRQGYEGKVRLPSGTYAGYNTALGTLGGSWSGEDGASTYTSTVGGGTATFAWWPEGRGDAKYDAWSPLHINTSAQSWAGNSNAADTSIAFNSTYASQMLNFGIDYNARLTSPGIKGQMDLILMAVKNRLVIQNYYEATQRTMTEMVPMPSGESVPSAQGSALSVAKPVMFHNGVALSTDYDIDDPDLMIGLPINAVEYRTVHSAGPTGKMRLMTTYRGEIPGGSGQMIGGRSHGQFIINSPKKLVFWYPHGNYTTD
jgi:hypothetical protein